MMIIIDRILPTLDLLKINLPVSFSIWIVSVFIVNNVFFSFFRFEYVAFRCCCFKKKNTHTHRHTKINQKYKPLIKTKQNIDKKKTEKIYKKIK